MMTFLQSAGLRAYGILVSDGQPHDAEVGGIRVQAFSEAEVGAEDGILVTLKPASQAGVVADLQAHGVAHEQMLCQDLFFQPSQTAAYCEEFLAVTKMLQQKQPSVSVAEIGIGAGDTAVPLCKCLRGGDKYICYDFAASLDRLMKKLRIPEVTCEIEAHGNTGGRWDSYVWGLSEELLAMRERGEDGIYDVAYLDGAHTLFHDGAACCLLKQLVKPGGYLIFDDLQWSYATSPTVNPEKSPWVRDLMTDEQIADRQVARVVKCFMDGDASFRNLSGETAPRAVFQRLA